MIPGGNSKGFSEQTKLLLPGEQVAPVALVATALLCHLKENGLALVDGKIRCAEADKGTHVTLHVYEAQVEMNSAWDDSNSDNLWLAAAQKVD